MTIEEVFIAENISVRSLNICVYNDLESLPAILNYYLENKTFKNIRNCGGKSNEELTDLCLKYIDKELLDSFDQKKTENSLSTKINDLSRTQRETENSLSTKINDLSRTQRETENSLSTKINDLSRTQREIVNSFIEINTNNLSARSKNAITSFLNENLKIRNISERILANDKFNFQDIKNVGTKTVTELKSFFDTIIDFIEKVAEVEHENDLVALRNRFFIEKTFSISSIPNEILESQSIFSLVDFLISKDAIFEKNKNIIFQKAFKILKNQLELQTDDIAIELNLSKERVRQIKEKCSQELYEKFQFVKNFDFCLNQNYGINIFQNSIDIDDSVTRLVNEKNETNFSKEFVTYLIFSYLSDEFELIGEIEDVLQMKNLKSRGRHNWNNFYLVSKKISRLFNFNDFANDLDKRSSERLEESYNFNFNSYLLNFSTSTNLDVLNEISEVAEKILNNEFGIFIDTEDNISFIRNSIKQVYEYAYDALKFLGKQSSIDEITKKVEELHPDFETNEAKVRASMKRQNGFVPIGRRSIFGLKEWENELENFKGGTIRSIVSEYLESEVEPKHISNITEYVLNYRPNTYERSILDNLKADETKTFIFFKNSTIGLRSKKYDSSFVKLNQIESQDFKSWQDRFNDLAQFISLNNRIPFSSGCPNEEIRLYKWYIVQEGKTKKGKLDSEKCNLLNEIAIQFNRNDINRKMRSNNGERYIDLKQFVFLNNRLPSANKTGEENLYKFFYKQRKLFEQGKLEQSEENKFIEIAKIIQSHKYENKRN